MLLSNVSPVCVSKCVWQVYATMLHSVQSVAVILLQLFCIPDAVLLYTSYFDFFNGGCCLICVDQAYSVFTMLHALHAKLSSHEKAVRPFASLSNVWNVNCDKMEERSVQIVIPYKRSFILVFWEEEWLVGGRSLPPEILGQADHVGAKLPIFSWYSLIAPQQ